MEMEEQYVNSAQTKEFLELVGPWERDAAAYREATKRRSEIDVAYGAEAGQKVDVFFPEGGDDKKTRSVVLFIHGGYWQSMGKSFFSHYARGANERGLTVAVVGHTLCPNATMSAVVKEIAQAAAFVSQRFDRRVTVCGHSSGGHLAACIASDRWREIGPLSSPQPVSGALIISGLFDLEPLLQTTLNGALQLEAAEARRLSPIHWSAAPGQRVVAYVGGRETSEFHRQTRDFAATWKGRGGNVTTVEVAGASHFSVAEPLTNPDSAQTRDLVSLATS